MQVKCEMNNCENTIEATREELSDEDFMCLCDPCLEFWMIWMNRNNR